LLFLFPVCKEDSDECLKDQVGYLAIVQIHQSIDDDHDGDVDLEESGEVIYSLFYTNHVTRQTSKLFIYLSIKWN